MLFFPHSLLGSIPTKFELICNVLLLHFPRGAFCALFCFCIFFRSHSPCPFLHIHTYPFPQACRSPSIVSLHLDLLTHVFQEVLPPLLSLIISPTSSFIICLMSCSLCFLSEVLQGRERVCSDCPVPYILEVASYEMLLILKYWKREH